MGSHANTVDEQVRSVDIVSNLINRSRGMMKNAEGLTIDNEYDEKCFDQVDVWVLRSCTSGLAWRIPTPVLNLELHSEGVRVQGSQDPQDYGSSKFKGKNTRACPLTIANKCTYISVQPASDDLANASCGMVEYRSSDGASSEFSRRYRSLDQQGAFNWVDHPNSHAARNALALGDDYRHLLVKCYLLHLQAIMHHRIDGAKILAAPVDVDAGPINVTDLGNYCTRYRSVVDVGRLSGGAIQMLAYAKKAWPCQSVVFPKSDGTSDLDFSDFTNTLVMEEDSLFICTRNDRT